MAFLGIDVGTSGAKVVVLDESGALVAQASEEYPLSSPKPGWTEQNPEDWWRAVSSCLESLQGHKIRSIGLTGQNHGTVFLDGNGEVVRPALLWNDQRTIHEVEEIERAVDVRTLTANAPLTGFQLPKVLWLRNNEPDAFRRVRKVLLPKDYIRFKLTGTFATEVSDASGTGCFDVINRAWSASVMSALDLDEDLFPRCLESDEISAETATMIPVVGGGGDQAASAVGTGATKPGVISASMGTSGVIFAPLARPEAISGDTVHLFCHANRGWHKMGVTLNFAGAMAWFRRTFCPQRSYAEIDVMASSVISDDLMFLPYLNGERCPLNRPDATASFLGMNSTHELPHMARAVMEGAVLALADAYDAVGVTAAEVIVTGGGAKSDLWVSMLATQLGVPCVRLEAEEGPAMGAAMLAGVGAGFWTLEDAVATCVKKASTVTPGPGNDRLAQFKERSAQYR